MAVAKKTKKKLKKYEILVDDLGPVPKNYIKADNQSKTAVQRFLKELVHGVNLKQKQELLVAVYDEHIKDRDWHPGILDFLLNSAIENKFKKWLDTTFIVGTKAYLIKEKAQSDNDKEKGNKK